MIIVNSSKIKRNFKEKLKIYKEMINIGNLECPCCHSKEYVKWGFYERGVTYMDQGKLCIEIIEIQRVRCKSCEKTHALLPLGITPYKQLTDEVIISIFLNEPIATYFEEATRKYYKKQYLKYHYPNLSTMLNIRDKLKILQILKRQTAEILEKYIKIHNKCFMQIKLGYILFCTS